MLDPTLSLVNSLLSMDKITDLPPANPHSDDRFAAPFPPVTTSLAHPPYTEMIYAAITALKDKDGSSKQAISKYIEKEFANLPPTHSILLTFNLKRMKNLGQIVMVKHSYMLPPRSAQFQPPESTGYHPTIDFATASTVDESNVASVGANLQNLQNSASGSLKRRPGRPPKLKPVPGLGVNNQASEGQAYDAEMRSYQPQFQYQAGGSAGGGEDHGVGYRSGSDFQGGSAGGSEPLFASLGLGDDGVVVPALPPPENTPVAVKRGRGRPPKSASASGGRVVSSAAAGVAAGGDSQIQVHVAGSEGGGGQGQGQGVEAGDERAVTKLNGVRVKRGRGRPRRIGFGAVPVPLSGNYLKPRGRPKRVRSNVAVNSGAGDAVLGARRRGRPSRNMVADLVAKQLSKQGKPGTAVLVTDPNQLVVYQELKSKYEHLQSKVKEVASMVRSYIDPEYGSAALGALQELEDLAAEVSEPSHGQTN